METQYITNVTAFRKWLCASDFIVRPISVDEKTSNAEEGRSRTLLNMRTIPETKTCKVCGRELPASEFYVISGNRDGLDTQCRECKKAYKAEWRERLKKKKRTD